MKPLFTLFLISLLSVGSYAKASLFSVKQDTVYSIVDEMPEFKGGVLALNKYLKSSVAYPKAANETGIRAKVYVRFVVDEKGIVRNTEVVRTSYNKQQNKLDKADLSLLLEQIEAEAIRTIQALPPWNPGKIEGKEVKVRTMIPLEFCPEKG